MPEPRDPNLPPETDPLPPDDKPQDQPPAEPTAEEVLRKENEELKKKFGASTTENQVLTERLKAEENARKELTKEPTDSDLKAAFPEWEQMTETEKMLARRTFNSERISQSALTTVSKFQSEREWQTSIELASTDPALLGKEDAFKKYASKPQYRNVPAEVLRDAFLGTLSPESRPAPKPGLQPGNGGPRNDPKPKGITSDDLSAMRRNSPREYEKYIKTHPIDLSDL
jgi:hypothetical protein